MASKRKKPAIDPLETAVRDLLRALGRNPVGGMEATPERAAEAPLGEAVQGRGGPGEGGQEQREGAGDHGVGNDEGEHDCGAEHGALLPSVRRLAQERVGGSGRAP